MHLSVLQNSIMSYYCLISGETNEIYNLFLYHDTKTILIFQDKITKTFSFQKTFANQIRIMERQMQIDKVKH